jgi:ABC-type branched-subunit amino acid transport system ATPase component
MLGQMSASQRVGVDTYSDQVVRVEDVTVRFGGIAAVSEVTLAIHAGRVTGIIGPNGAGKTTLFGVISGLTRPTRGKVYLGDKDVTSMPAYQRAQMGLARTFQHSEIFSDLTVREHAVLAHRLSARTRGTGRVSWMSPAGSSRRHADEARAIDEILVALQLQDVAGVQAIQLPLATRRLVEVARALATQPRVVLLDEPASGLDADERARLAALLGDCCERFPVALVLVEHNIDLLSQVADVVHVLDLGCLVASGPTREVMSSPVVRKAYLGVEVEDPA